MRSLNQDQLETASTDASTPFMVMASPGSGNGLPPSHILAITFMATAVSEMRDQIRAVAGKEIAKELTISTFHSFSLQLCRSHADKELATEKKGTVLRGCLRADSRSSKLYLGLLLRVPAFSVADGEVSTGGPIAGDLPRRSRSVGFSPETVSLMTFLVTRDSPEFQNLLFSFQKRRFEVLYGRFVCFSLFAVAGLCFYLDNGICLLVSLLRLISMRGGYKRFVAIESKSFDLAIVGTVEDVLKISENGRGRRTSLLLPENLALWLLRAWGRFCKSKSPNWCNQMCRGSNIFLLESKRSRAGNFLQLSVINKGKRTFVIFLTGWNERGW
ncbi:hypothetical protein Cgig2_007161 [Carnegiea gigantea]|uniref:UvrD-like helicase ATP-binding domain-containing protein n=1 Tax=Carnegiea gigantea TaxID=171969 RepID=A0A9Q1GSZ6_9CARY|nr:hypothetical protein Cgig2_007161 [Carnegiea gigantea]